MGLIESIKDYQLTSRSPVLAIIVIILLLVEIMENVDCRMSLKTLLAGAGPIWARPKVFGRCKSLFERKIEPKCLLKVKVYYLHVIFIKIFFAPNYTALLN